MARRSVSVNCDAERRTAPFCSPDRDSSTPAAVNRDAGRRTAWPQGMPRVSVIVPNYNHVRFLERRIASILAQTYGDFELLILDDAFN